jgi:Lrp/AsnC family leucine-responsive transcriptional regulator
VIAGYSAVLDPIALGKHHVAFVMVTLSEGNEFAADDPIVAQICEEPDILEFHRVAGEDCYMIKIRTSTNADLEKVLRHIKSIRGVARTRTTIVLSTELEKPTIEVPVEDDARPVPQQV